MLEPPARSFASETEMIRSHGSATFPRSLPADRWLRCGSVLSRRQPLDSQPQSQCVQEDQDGTKSRYARKSERAIEILP